MRNQTLRCLIAAIAILAMVGGVVPPAIAWSGTTYYEAEITGKVMSPASGGQPGIVYGDLRVKNSNWKWQTLSTGKFYKVSSKSTRTQQALNNQVGKGVRILGSYNSSYLQRGGLFTATRVEAKEIKDGPPQLTLFGVFRNPGQAVGTELRHPVDFVARLAALRDAAIGKDGELYVPSLAMSPEQVQKFVADVEKDPKKKAIKTALTNEWRANWKTRNFVERDLDVYNAALATARSVSFATGWAGTGLDAMLGFVPAQRKDIEKAMLGGVKGGSAPDQEGVAVMLARISSLDTDGFKLYWVDGPLFDTPQGLAQGIVSADEKDGQTWEARGMNSVRAEALDGQVCWVSGSRVIVRDPKTGAIVDKYFAVDKTMTYQETVSGFNLIEQLAKRGGI